MRLLRRVLAPCLVLLAWLAIKYAFGVPDRYLPGLGALVRAVSDIGADWLVHIGATLARTLVGFFLGVLSGVMLSLTLFRFKLLPWVMAAVNSLRAIPPVAAVPFFLLWFGFSEMGRYLLVVLGLGLNVFVACADTLEHPREYDLVLFSNLQAGLNSKVVVYWLPRVIEGLLPTLRFGVSLALGVIVVSEMLGAQSGLGYLMQTSRATFSLNVIFLCAGVLGAIAVALDAGLQAIWRRAVPWRR